MAARIQGLDLEEGEIPDSERRVRSRARPDAVRRQLEEELRCSIFEIGGSRKPATLPTGGGGRDSEYSQSDDEHKEPARRGEMEYLQAQYWAMNDELAELVHARDTAILDNRTVTKQHKQEIRTLSAQKDDCASQILSLRKVVLEQEKKANEGRREVEQVESHLYDLRAAYARSREEVAALQAAKKRLEQEQAAQIESNEAARQQILDETQNMDDRRAVLTRELNELAARKARLTMELGPGVPSGPGLATSTPAGGRAKQPPRVSFNPDINEESYRNVTDGRYNPHQGRQEDPRAPEGPRGSPGQEDPLLVPLYRRDDRGGAHSGGGGSQNPRAGGSRYTRRSSMSLGMQSIHDENPCIAGLGIDCYSRVSDGSDVITWSMRQADRLQGARNAARRIAKIPRPYNGSRPWKEEYENFVDDMVSSGWNKEESLCHLVGWLKDGPGRVAVEQWRAEYGSRGTYDDLLTCASYLFGSLVAEDPMMAFKKRTQKPKENHKVFGLDLQSLLRKCRPGWRYDAEDYITELFSAFVKGLRDPEQGRVAYEAWGPTTSLADLFIAIDCHEKKKRILGGYIPERASVIQFGYSEDGGTDTSYTESSSEDEDYVGALTTNPKYTKNGGRRFGKAPESREKKGRFPRKEGGREERPRRKFVKPPPVDTSDPQKEVKKEKVVPTMELDMLESLADKVAERLRSTRRGPMDYSRAICYRCQQIGHISHGCTAEKPVPRHFGGEKKLEN
jgi:hypothetical protein